MIYQLPPVLAFLSFLHSFSLRGSGSVWIKVKVSVSIGAVAVFLPCNRMLQWVIPLTALLSGWALSTSHSAVVSQSNELNQPNSTQLKSSRVGWSQVNPPIRCYNFILGLPALPSFDRFSVGIESGWWGQCRFERWRLSWSWSWLLCCSFKMGDMLL